MGMPHYLAMTAAEWREAPVLPSAAAWMACHFSPYRTALSNLPRSLPAGSLLVLDDVTPICGHDPEAICAQLEALASGISCSGLLLDLQRPGYPEAAALAGYLSGQLPFPVAVSELYAQGLSCPVFLPPVPLHIPLEEYLFPWQGREIWLELAWEGQMLTLTREGLATASLPCSGFPDAGFGDAELHCHYRIAASPEAARFTLWRTGEDMDALMEEAKSHGVTTTVGLYQQWRQLSPSAGDPLDPADDLTG